MYSTTKSSSIKLISSLLSALSRERERERERKLYKELRERNIEIEMRGRERKGKAVCCTLVNVKSSFENLVLMIHVITASTS